MKHSEPGAKVDQAILDEQSAKAAEKAKQRLEAVLHPKKSKKDE